MNLNVLNELHLAFMEASVNGTGSLDIEEFKEIVNNALQIQGRVTAIVLVHATSNNNKKNSQNNNRIRKRSRRSS